LPELLHETDDGIALDRLTRELATATGLLA
jgi:hypothetical protein